MARDHIHDPVRTAAREADEEARRMVLTPTQARQGSPRRMNLRVLVTSLVIIGALGLALTAAYWGAAVENHAVPAGAAQKTETSKVPDGSAQPKQP
jgi:hypothetical protein